MTLSPLKTGMVLVATLAALAAASTTLSTIFVGRDYVLLAALASAAAIFLSLGLRAAGVRGAAVVFANVGLFLVVSSLVLFRSEGIGAPGLVAAWRGATGGLVDLLRAPSSSEPTSHLLMPAILIGWSASALTAEILLRSRRSAMAVIPLVAGVVAFLYLGAGRSTRPALALGLAILLLLCLWMTSAPDLSGRFDLAGLRNVAAAVAVGGIALLVGAAVARTVDDADRFDPRAGRVPPVELQDAVSPLTQLKAQLLTDTQEGTEPNRLFDITLTDADADFVAPSELFIRTAALGSYDGVLWISSSSYPVIGSGLGDASSSFDQASFELTTTSDYRDQFYPLVGDPVTAQTEGDTGFSRETDTLLSREPVTGITFSFETQLLANPEGALSGASAAVTGDVQRFLAVPDGTPAELLALLDELDQDPTLTPGSGARLLALRDLLADGFGYSEEAPSGHSLAALAQYAGTVESTNGFQDHVGYAEQGAALFALLARADGYPTRLAVGYRLLETELGTGEPASVSTADAWAWPEVNMASLGWVPIAGATPSKEQAVEALEAPSVSAATEPSRRTAPIPLPEIEDISSGGSTSTAGASSLSKWWLVPFVGLALLLSPLVAKAVRRRRRLKRPDPARAVLGHWFEVRDRLRDNGLPVGPSFTAREIAGLAEAEGFAPAGSSIDALARLTDTALYEPELVDDEQLKAMGAFEKMFYEEVNQEMAITRRVPARLSLRGLSPVKPVSSKPPPVFAEVAGL